MPDIGPHRPNDRWRGLLSFDWLAGGLQRAEDSRLDADYDCAQTCFGNTFKRPASTTERDLLAHLGFTDLSDNVVVVVSYRNPGIRNRRFYDKGRELTL